MNIEQETIKLLKALLREVKGNYGHKTYDGSNDWGALYQCWYCEAKTETATPFDHDADCLITRIKAQLEDGSE